VLQEIFLQPGRGEAVTPGAGKCRDKCLGEGQGENAPRFLALSPSWKASWKAERLGCWHHTPQGDLILLHLSEYGGWTALDTSIMMSCSQPTSGQPWSLTHLPGRTESKPTGAHPPCTLCTMGAISGSPHIIHPACLGRTFGCWQSPRAVGNAILCLKAAYPPRDELRPDVPKSKAAFGSVGRVPAMCTPSSKQHRRDPGMNMFTDRLLLCWPGFLRK